MQFIGTYEACMRVQDLSPTRLRYTQIQRFKKKLKKQERVLILLIN